MQSKVAHSQADDTAKPARTFRGWLSSLGPSIITAALVFGPSKMTITSKMGAEYGYSLLWIIVMAIFFMTVFTTMSTRIGLATNQSLLATIRQKWGNGAALAVGIGVFLVATSFQAGNSIGVGISIAESTHTPVNLWIALFTILGIGLLFFRTFYKVLEKLMIFLIGVMVVAFMITLGFAGPDYSEVVTGFVPSMPTGSLGLIIAFTASSFSIVGAFYQSYLVQERVRVNPAVRSQPVDTVTGMTLMGLMSATVLICAAAVLHPKGLKVASASDMGKALEPIFGPYASALFLIGLFGASFSSLVGNATVGGTLLGEALGFGNQLGSKVVKYLIALVMVIGASIAIIFGKLPLELIIFAQSITILVVPFIGVAMYAIGNDSAIMGRYTNSTFVKIIGALGLLVIFGLALSNVNQLFFK
ncbi:NRAMP (natural resistance-associated macrophage protein)-like metal ion transporter [Larkinella arboricola]|uniref:NRAMP (Natural resistance-associated macrophage protein)-like metal ion transporter n=1 Tax=Larkinella arboricola TaxID=643671 RepID=A0A327WLF1_LARAB|nr:Nramp family divalent metal transporter [Larkinella arboricola]RAJ92585.1 NRAMP (natural resistance-associated macrophage protein)-like metal ion transporter [Larkinella arboricola]